MDAGDGDFILAVFRALRLGGGSAGAMSECRGGMESAERDEGGAAACSGSLRSARARVKSV